jgi:high affinity Mn2+ porin
MIIRRRHPRAGIALLAILLALPAFATGFAQQPSSETSDPQAADWRHRDLFAGDYTTPAADPDAATDAQPTNGATGGDAADGASPADKNVAAGDQPPSHWSIHFQDTFVLQGTPGFRSPYKAQTSLSPNQIRETNSDTLFLAYSPWQGGSLVVNPEYSQGIGLSHTYGVAGFPNGEAQKASDLQGKEDISRIYIRQVFGLGGEKEPVADAENQIAGEQDISRFTVQFGKFAMNDNVDDNTYNHDERNQFLNWSIWESGAWDYPADSKGYTYGLYLEYNQKNYTLRFVHAQVPKVVNGLALDNQFWLRFGEVLELETRFKIHDHPGKLRTLGFVNRTNSATYNDLVADPDVNPLKLRANRLKYGGALTGEQEITSDLGAFFRLSINDGQTQSWSFTDIDQSASVGLSLKGTRWQRPDDTIGLAAVVNGISKAHQEYLNAGGVGLTVGDGQLPHYGTENIVELYYDVRLPEFGLPEVGGKVVPSLTFDYQFVDHPAYNEDRGPAHILGARLHAEY